MLQERREKIVELFFSSSISSVWSNLLLDDAVFSSLFSEPEARAVRHAGLGEPERTTGEQCYRSAGVGHICRSENSFTKALVTPSVRQ